MVYAVFTICPATLTDRNEWQSSVNNGKQNGTHWVPFHAISAVYFLMRITGVSPTVT